jgi:hypothetical protein
MEYIYSTWIPHGMWGHGKVLLPAHPQDHIGKPDQFRHHGKTLFFGWWASTGVDI